MRKRGFITINGKVFPYPDRGLVLRKTTLTKNGRNPVGTVVGEVVGREQNKIDNLSWNFLDAETWAEMCQEFSKFKIEVRFPDMTTGSWITLMMYVGDRTAEPYFVDVERGGLPTHYRKCKCNIIDVGEQ